MTDINVPECHKEHMIQGLIEVLGTIEAFTFLDALHEGGLEPYDLATRGILIRGGRAGFNYWLKQNLDLLGWNSLDFRMHPVKNKILNGLQGIVQQIENDNGPRVQLVNAPKQWKLTLTPHPDTASHHTDFSCSYLLGFLQEFCRWAGLGKFYFVNLRSDLEIEKLPCEITIQKEPLD